MRCFSDSELAAHDAELVAPLKAEIVQLTARVKFLTEPYKDEELMMESMTPHHLQGYEFGVKGSYIAIQNILEGKDKGEGTSVEPWQSQRMVLVHLVNLKNSLEAMLKRHGQLKVDA